MPLEDALELRPYKGYKKNIGIYLPNPFIVTVVEALDILRLSHSHYTAFEGKFDGIRHSDTNSYIVPSTPILYLAKDTMQKGRMHCLIDIVHETEEKNLLNSRLDPKERDLLCFNKEADCLEVLGDKYWKELKIGFSYDRNAYIGLRILDMEINQNNRTD